MRRIYFLLLALPFLVFACKDDDSTSGGPNSSNPPEASMANPQLSGTSVNADFFGRVFDENMEPVSGALVRIGSATTTTDTYGFYTLNGVSVDENFALLSVTSGGFYEQYRNLRPQTDRVNVETIQLIKRTFSGAFQTDQGGSFDIPGGGRVIFSAGSMVLPDGTPYEGQVAVASTYLNPIDDLLNLYLPGSLLGVESDDELALLTTYGMVGVELFSSGGQMLQLAEGQTATIEFPIQDAQMGTAPESIELWFFDENTGIWREEGSATKSGTIYVAEVSHFTFWNCDIPGNWVYVSGTIDCEDIQNLPYGIIVELTRPSGESANALLDSNGFYDGYVPPNEVLDLSVTINCENQEQVINLGEVGPFQDNATIDLGIIECPEVNLTELNLTGTLVDCEGNPVEGLFIDLDWNYGIPGYIYTDENGSFDLDFSCLGVGEEYELAILDLENFLQAWNGSFVWDGTTSTIDLGTLVYCEGIQLDNYISYTEGSNVFLFSAVQSYPSLSIGEVCHLMTGTILNQFDHNRKASLRTDQLTGIGTYDLCGGSGTISQTMRYRMDNDNFYVAEASSATYTITELEGEFGEDDTWDYALLDGSFIMDVDVTIYADTNQLSVIDSYSASASGAFRYEL